MGMSIDNLCNSCTNSGCEFQSGIVRTKCAFYMPPTVRLIDADLLREEVYSWGMNDYEPLDFVDAIDDAPTVEAISKANYEARLKADKLAMLTEIQLEVRKLWDNDTSYIEGVYDAEKVIQQKIDSLKGK